MPNCKDCHAELTDANWSPSSQREHRYICRGCAVVRATKHATANRSAKRRYQAAYYRERKAAFKAKAKAYQKAHPEKAREWNRASYLRHKKSRDAKTREWSKAKRVVLRRELLEAYGHACACCGEARAEFLALDHTNGDGAIHRRELSHEAICKWLKRHKWPKDRFRLLCHNCNSARGFYGYCPHERERATASA
jgi:hypothetical protein